MKKGKKKTSPQNGITAAMLQLVVSVVEHEKLSRVFHVYSMNANVDNTRFNNFKLNIA